MSVRYRTPNIRALAGKLKDAMARSLTPREQATVILVTVLFLLGAVVRLIRHWRF